MKRLLVLLLALSMLLSALPAAAAEKEINSDEIWETITEIENQKIRPKRGTAATAEDYAAIVDDVIAAVEASDSYQEGTIERHGDFFFWETMDGEPNGYSPRLRTQIRNSAVIDEEPETVSSIQTVSYATRNSSDGTNVAVFQPYYGLDSSFTNQYKTEGESVAKVTGGTCTTYRTTNATIDAIADALETCGVVFFDSHGDTDYYNPYDDEDFVSKANTSYICLQTGTGLTTADQQRVTGTYGTYYHAYNAGSNGSMKYYCVDGTAIANHMEKAAPNNLLWMAICLGMATDGLNAPLREKGVGVVYGYSQSVTFDGDYFWEETFWNGMKNNKTVAAAISEMKTKCGKWDYSQELYTANGWSKDSDLCSTITQAQKNRAAFPIVVSAEDSYPGKGNVDNLQTVCSTWTLKESTEPSYTFTAQSNNTAYGTVSVLDNVITATPSIGCEVVGYTVDPTNAATVTKNGITFVVTNLTANCTITINFKQGTVPPQHDCPCDDYYDLSSEQWYHAGVDYALENGLMNGVGGGRFDPDGSLTRAMLVTILYRSENTPDVSGESNPFADVPDGQWYTDAVIWAAKEGIVNGTSKTTFAPNDSITREQIATILCRYAGSPKVSGDFASFSDASSVSAYAYDAMRWAVQSGIINGTDGKLAPQDNATRAQIATILMRFCTQNPVVTLEGSALYRIVKEDRSWKNSNGDILVSNCYDRVILKNASHGESINALIKADMEQFFDNDIRDLFQNAQEIESLFDSWGLDYGSFFYNAGATVTHNEDDIFSICIATEWYMGGVFNADRYGLTFDLRTGERVTIPQLVEMDEAALKEKLDAIVMYYLYDKYGGSFLNDPREVLEKLTPEDYLFYVEEGEIILCFPTYTFGPGAAGCEIISTGIMLGNR